MTGWEYYAVVLLVDFGTFLIAAWGLNLEFGVAGVPNLAYIFLVAAGAYTYAVTTCSAGTFPTPSRSSAQPRSPQRSAPSSA